MKKCDVSEAFLRKDCDVLVVGGGTSGVIAAIAAAKNGADTILVEKNDYLGGAMLGGGVIWMGFYNLFRPYGREPVQLVRGLADELIARLRAVNGITDFYEELACPDHESVGIHADRELLPKVFFEMAEEYGVKVVLNTTVNDTVMDGTTVCGAVVENADGKTAIFAKAVIDCSGNGAAAANAGVPVHDIAERKSGGMVFGLDNVDFNKAKDYLESRNMLAYLGYADKGGEGKDRVARLGFYLSKMPEFDEGREKYGFHIEPCIVSTRENVAGMVNGVTKNFNTTDPEELAKVTAELKEGCYQFAKALRELLPGFENCELTWTSPTPGLRFGRYVECDYDLSQSDIEKNLIPDDTIGVFGTQDAHYMGYDIKGGGWYGIPYRALIAKGVDNLLVAGKSLSSDWVVWMSTRLIGACFLEGQAAGTAAALAAKKGTTVRDIDTDELRALLLKDGAFLG